MEMDRRKHGDVTVLALAGELDSTNLPALRDEIDGLIGNGRTRVCLNCDGLSFVNSTALSYLVAARKRMAGKGGELVLSEPSRFFRSTIRTLELHHIFEIFATDAEALAHFGGASGANAAGT